MGKYMPYIVMLVIAAIAVVVYHKYFNKQAPAPAPPGGSITPLPGTSTPPFNTGLDFYTENQFSDVA